MWTQSNEEGEERGIGVHRATEAHPAIEEFQAGGVQPHQTLEGGMAPLEEPTPENLGKTDKEPLQEHKNEDASIVEEKTTKSEIAPNAE